MRFLRFNALLFCMSSAFLPWVYGQENQWLKIGDFLGGKRERGVAFSIGNDGFVGTGTDTSEIVHKDFWKFDGITETWTQVADIPGPARRDAVAFSINGKGYVGTGMSDHVSANGVPLSDFWSYSPLLNQWDSIAPYPGNQFGGVYFSTGFNVRDKGYVCGGKCGNSSYSNELWEYKPSTDTWVARAPFPTGIRYMLNSFSIGDFGYVGLGATQDVYKRDFYRFNPANNTWLAIPDLPGNVRGSATTFVLQDKGYVCGGYDGGLLDDLWEYDPIESTWTIKAYFGGSERRNAIAFSIDNTYAIVGLGKGYSGKKESLYKYFPTQYLGLDTYQIGDFKIYPNPGKRNLQLLGPIANLAYLECLSLDGSLVFSSNNGNIFEQIQLLNNGVYFVRFYGQSGRLINTEKLIVYE